ncbi:hypothetical protein G7054_g533 [Neopestalotiopsis clavispora]|nr:hypothetical protein G7054_g533 [Neopestalotiopsis clavispora]
MKLLALSCGSPGGNTELVLLAALRAAQAADPALTIELIRINELKLGPMNIGGMTPHPFSGANQNKDKERMGDDGSFVLDHIMEADAIILGAPVFSRCASWTVKWFADHVMGPFQDIVAARKMVADGKGQLVDQRIFKPHVAGLISLGGALGTEWSSFGLPTLHQVFFSMGIQVVDQMEIFGAGLSGCVVLDDAAIARAESMARGLVGQAAKPAVEQTYVGPKGACPVCHLSVITFTGGDDIDCATCGAKGKALVKDGKIALEFSAGGQEISVKRTSGMEIHMKEIGHVASKLRPQMSEVPVKKAALEELAGKILVPAPSKQMAV